MPTITQDLRERHIFYVSSFDPRKQNTQYVVNLREQSCTCEGWTFTRIKNWVTYASHKHVLEVLMAIHQAKLDVTL